MKGVSVSIMQFNPRINPLIGIVRGFDDESILALLNPQYEDAERWIDIDYWAPSDYGTPWGSGGVETWGDFEVQVETMLRGAEAVAARDAFFQDMHRTPVRNEPGRVITFTPPVVPTAATVVSNVVALTPFFQAMYLPWEMDPRTQVELEALLDSPRPARRLRRVDKVLWGPDPRAAAVKQWFRSANATRRFSPNVLDAVEHDCIMFTRCLLGSGSIWLSRLWGDSVIRGMTRPS